MDRLTILSILVSISFGSTSSFAFTPTIAANGATVYWHGNVKLNLAGNPTNSSGLAAGAFFDSVVHSLQRWQAASNGAVSFDYWQGTDPKIYAPNSNYNGTSSIYFASNANGATGLSPNVLGLTQVWYNTSSGQILETDVVLNDNDFRFTENPSDTSGYGSQGATYSGGKANVFVENVLTHELGHAYGLSHAGGLQSTMLYMESPEQAHLGCDDQIAIHSVYPTSDQGSRGSISGQIVNDSGAAVFGAHVLAISRQRGTVLATTMTDHGGNYNLNAIEPGTYFLMVEPYYAGASALPSYYSGMNINICPGNTAFSRSFLMNGSIPTPVAVSAGNRTQAPTFAAHCGQKNGADVSAVSGSSSLSTAPSIYSGGSGFGIVGQNNPSGTNYFRIDNVSGHLELSVLSYSIYSPIKPTLQLLDSNGNQVSVENQSPVYAGDSGYVNYDSRIVADGLIGTYYLEVTGTNMAPLLYPAGPISLDTVPFLVVTGSVNESAPVLTSLPENARCRMVENFTSYTSPPGNPPVSNVGNSSGGAGGCGMIQKVGDQAGPHDDGTSTGAKLGWILPWVMMGFIARRMKKAVLSYKA